jgi:hypothetical protein
VPAKTCPRNCNGAKLPLPIKQGSLFANDFSLVGQKSPEKRFPNAADLAFAAAW